MSNYPKMGENPINKTPSRPQRLFKPIREADKFFKDINARFLFVSNISDTVNGFSKLSMISICRDICTLTGITPYKLQIRKLKSGDIQVRLENSEQSNKLRKANKFPLLDIDIEVSLDNISNRSKCRVYNVEWEDNSVDEIKDFLNDYREGNPFCTQVYRCTKQGANGPEMNHLYILTFDAPFPPEKVPAGGTLVVTKKHIMPPLQCMTCFTLNRHTTKNCPNKDKICKLCHLMHTGECSSHLCINCSYDPERKHTEIDPDCPEWCYAFEVNNCMATDRRSRFEAKKLIDDEIRQGTYDNSPLVHILKRFRLDEKTIKPPSYLEALTGRMDSIGKMTVHHKMIHNRLRQLSAVPISDTLSSTSNTEGPSEFLDEQHLQPQLDITLPPAEFSDDSTESANVSASDIQAILENEENSFARTPAKRSKSSDSSEQSVSPNDFKTSTAKKKRKSSKSSTPKLIDSDISTNNSVRTSESDQNLSDSNQQ